MQALNISSLTDYKLEALASKIQEMKHASIFSINSTLTKPNSWSSIKVKLFLTIGTPTTVYHIIPIYCIVLQMFLKW